MNLWVPAIIVIGVAIVVFLTWREERLKAKKIWPSESPSESPSASPSPSLAEDEDN